MLMIMMLMCHVHGVCIDTSFASFIVKSTGVTRDIAYMFIVLLTNICLCDKCPGLSLSV